MENTETQVWLDYALSCRYINRVIYNESLRKAQEIGKLLNFMMENPGKFSEGIRIRKQTEN